MLYIRETEQGSITIRKPVIGSIIIKAIGRQNGRVLLSNHKGKLIRIKYKHGSIDASDFIEITFDEKGVDIRFFIAIKFGTSISMVTEQLIQELKRDIEYLTGLEANSIAVVVTGLIAKQITRRNIEVKG